MASEGVESQMATEHGVGEEPIRGLGIVCFYQEADVRRLGWDQIVRVARSHSDVLMLPGGGAP